MLYQQQMHQVSFYLVLQKHFLRPELAENVWDKEGILTEINEESIEKFAAKVAEQIRFGSNMRAGAAYRRIVCQVLVKRALHTIVAENNGEEEKC